MHKLITIPFVSVLAAGAVLAQGTAPTAAPTLGRLLVTPAGPCTAASSAAGPIVARPVGPATFLAPPPLRGSSSGGSSAFVTRPVGAVTYIAPPPLRGSSSGGGSSFVTRPVGSARYIAPPPLRSGGGPVRVSPTEEGIEGSLAFYGDGTNPVGSLGVLAGAPRVGEELVFGVGNPLGTQPAGSLAFLALSTRPVSSYPFGTPVAGAGMRGAGRAGELLVDVSTTNPFLVVGPRPLPSAGEPAALAFAIPDDATLAGMDVYVQGAVHDPFQLGEVTLGLTDAARITIGG